MQTNRKKSPPTIQRLSAPSSGLEFRLSIESPQGEGASGSQARVYVVDEVKAAVAIGTFGRRFLPESKGIKRAAIFSQHDFNDHQILVTLSIDRKNFGKNWRHLRVSSTVIGVAKRSLQGLLFPSCFDRNPTTACQFGLGG
jgi:hypothetical protein